MMLQPSTAARGQQRHVSGWLLPVISETPLDEVSEPEGLVSSSPLSKDVRNTNYCCSRLLNGDSAPKSLVVDLAAISQEYCDTITGQNWRQQLRAIFSLVALLCGPILRQIKIESTAGNFAGFPFFITLYRNRQV